MARVTGLEPNLFFFIFQGFIALKNCDCCTMLILFCCTVRHASQPLNSIRISLIFATHRRTPIARAFSKEQKLILGASVFGGIGLAKIALIQYALSSFGQREYRIQFSFDNSCQQKAKMRVSSAIMALTTQSSLGHCDTRALHSNSIAVDQ